VSNIRELTGTGLPYCVGPSRGIMRAGKHQHGSKEVTGYPGALVKWREIVPAGCWWRVVGEEWWWWKVVLCGGEGGMIRDCVAHPFGAASGRSSRQAALLEPRRGFSFEPSIRCRIHTFQACSFSHSDTSPNFGLWFYVFSQHGIRCAVALERGVI